MCVDPQELAVRQLVARSGLALFRVELTFAGQTFSELVVAVDEESALRRGENNCYPARALRAWRVDTIDGCRVVVLPP